MYFELRNTTNNYEKPSTQQSTKFERNVQCIITLTN